eukprot:XP_014768516.1 PREDICTED: zinc finger BED domain-containing protein 5-like [Octopus bimaculoides]
MIHHEVLVSKSLPDGLLKWMDNIVKVVNYIKSHSLLRRVFAALCETMDSDFKCILLHTEVCWLSKGKVLSRFINNDNWWLDLFEKLNVSNLSLQKVNENIITITGKLKFFTSKLELWLRKVKNSQLDCFPGVETFPNKLKILSEVQKTVIAIIAVAYLQSALMKQIQSKTKDIQKVIIPSYFYVDVIVQCVHPFLRCGRDGSAAGVVCIAGVPVVDGVGVLQAVADFAVLVDDSATFVVVH